MPRIVFIQAIPHDFMNIIRLVEFVRVQINSAVVVGEQCRIARLKFFAVFSDKIAEKLELSERRIRDIQGAVPRSKQKFTPPRNNAGAVFGAVRIGAHVLPMLKIFAHPCHTVTRIQIPLVLPEKHSGIADRAIIGRSNRFGLVFVRKHRFFKLIPVVFSAGNFGQGQWVAICKLY